MLLWPIREMGGFLPIWTALVSVGRLQEGWIHLWKAWIRLHLPAEPAERAD
jgi:hypothetical protein